jgi:ArsR family transcriptional regulator, virulence genes transcriptional regulator
MECMMIRPSMDLATFETKAGEVSTLLKAMGNARRLMVLCKLVEHGEMTVSDLAHEVGLSQSALSQHLARMREEGLVAFRRESQTIWYRIADPRTEQLLASLYTIFCKE